MSTALEEQIERDEQRTAAGREALEARRRSLALDKIAGDPAAAAALRDTEAQLEELDRQAAHAALARVELQERLQAAQEAQERAERERMESELARCTGERDDALSQMQQAASAAGRHAAVVKDRHERCGDLSRALGRPWPPWTTLVESLLLVRLRDACPALPREFGPVRNYTANQLREEFPIPPAEPAAVGRPCSICGHEARQEIEAAVAAGESVRAVAERFRVSKSSVARHSEQHTDSCPAPLPTATD